MKKVDRNNVTDILRLTPMQEGILYHHLRRPGVAYFEQVCLRIEGPLDSNHFREAWRRVTARHEALRTVFRWEGIDHPVQIILRQHEPELSVCEPPNGADAEQFLADLKRRDRERGFDFEQVPFRISLCPLGDQKSAVLLSNHHILLDGWSTGLILQEFLQQYRALTDGEPAEAAPRRCRMKDFVKTRESQNAAGAERFWNDCLRGLERDTSLTSNATFGPTHEPRTDSCGLHLDDDVLADLKDLAASFNVTASAVLHAAWGLLLQRYANNDDVVFGTVVSGREMPLPGIFETAGLFINTLPMRFRAEGRTRLSECLRTVHAQMALRSEWQTSSLAEIGRWAGLPAGEDLFDTLLVIENYPLDSVLRARGPLRITGHEVFERTHYGITLTVEAFDRLHMSLAWREGGLNRESASRLLDHFANILSFLVRFPQQTVAELDIMTSAERERMLGSFNRTALAFRDTASTADLIFEQAARTPDRVGLVCGDDELTYRQLIAQAERIAGNLSRSGLPNGGVVAVNLPPCNGLIVSLLGIMRACGAYLPLDPSFPERRTDFVLQDSNAGFMIDAAPNGVESLRELHPAGPASGCAAAAYLIYTSGSTGAPKGVWVSHSNLVNFLTGMQQALPVGEPDVFLSLTTVSFDIFGLEVWLPLSMGCKVVLGTREQQLDPGAAANGMLRHGVSVYQVTPSRLRLQLENATFRDALRGLRVLLIGGESLPADLLRQVQALTQARIFNLYGPTETTIWSTVSELSRADQPDIGRPIANTSIHILSRTGAVQPPGLAGELCIGGEGVALGYHRREALTEARFREVGSLGRLYCTGDLARWLPDGRLICLGRIDDQLKIRGVRIEPGEIESALARHPAVKEAVVVARDRAGDPTLAAFWVAAPAGSASAESLRMFLAETLPATMIPAAFVVMDAMPLTGNGKIDRKSLPNPFEDIARPDAVAAVISETDRRVADIWCQVLGVASVGSDTRFFDAGGTSFGLIRLHGKLSAAFGKRLSVTDLFQLTTVRQQAAHLAGTDASISKAPPSRSPAGRGEIAVVGMAGRFPGAPDIASFWKLILEGREGLQHFSVSELLAEGIESELIAHPHYVKVKGCLEGADHFDAEFFSVAPKDAETMDPQIRQLAECSWEALEDAGYASGRDAGRFGLFVGSSANYHWLDFVGLPEGTTTRFDTIIRNEKDYLATRVAHMLNLTGPALTVQTACSTSLVAVDLAAQALLSGKADLALAGGIGLTYPLKSGYLHEDGMIFSPDGHCRPFDADAAGTVCGNGVGIVVLKLLEDAIADGDCIRAVLKGIAVNNDGSAKVGFTAPSVEGQSRVIALAHRTANVDPETIGYVETHGSATPLGDPIEVVALTRAFASQRRGFCALGSVKANVGHLDAAAGIAGFTKTVLALQHKTLPPSTNFSAPNSEIDFRATPFFVNTDARAWAGGLRPRRAAVSSFGIGGTNAHAVLEEAPEPPVRTMPTEGPHVLFVSARAPEQLQSLSERLASHFERHPELDPADAAFTLHAGRRQFAYRRVLVCEDLRQAAAGLAKPAAPAKAPGQTPPVVFLFGGLGSQYAGMCRGLYLSEPSFREPMDRCFDLLLPRLDLKLLLFPADQETASELRRFDVAQAAIFACGYALARMLIGWGVQPSAIAGYSFGEYVAACIAGVFTLEDAIEIVLERGRLMRQTEPGAMLSVPLPAAEVVPLLRGSLALAIDNGPSCVVSGLRDDVCAFAMAMKKRRVWALPLDGEHAMHSPVVSIAGQTLETTIARCRRHDPAIPLVSNLTGDYFHPGVAVDAKYWTRHLGETVRFSDTLRTLLKLPNAVFVEIGPGRDLIGLLQHQADPSTAGRSIHLVRHVQDPVDDCTFLLNKIGSLYLLGVEPDAAAFHRARGGRRVPLPTYPFEQRRYWPTRAGHAGPALKRTASATETGTSKAATLLYLPVWKQAPRLNDSAMPKSRWLLFSDGSSFPTALARELARRNHDVCIADPAAPPRIPDGPPPDHILHFRTLANGVAAPEAGLDQVCRDGFHDLLDLARHIGERAPDHRISVHVITEGAAEINGEGGLRPATALLRGPVRVIPFEYPNLACRLIDIRRPAEGTPAERELLQALIAECAQSGGPKEIALRGLLRWETVYEGLTPPRPSDGHVRFREGGVYLITGGFGALALALGRRLAERWHAKLILVGRTPPSPEAYADIEACGGEVVAETADVTDQSALTAVVERCQKRFGAIHGVFHLAGTADGALIQARSREQSDRVLAPKTHGTLALDAALRGISPDFLILYSSINAIIAPYGQVAYTSANAFLDSFALARTRSDPFTVSINWDAWKEAGMAVAARADGVGDLEQGISTAQGLDALEAILRGCEPRVAISTTDLSARLIRHERDGGVPVERLAPVSQVLISLRARPDLIVAYAPADDSIEEDIGGVLRQYLRLETVGIDDNFNDLGATSLDLIQIAQLLKRTLDREVAVLDLYKNPTVRGIARRLGQRAQAAESTELIVSQSAKERSNIGLKMKREMRTAGRASRE
ncbi:amino acid adenylation domain-containing protein [Bradyrhizobium ontarionense]|uniref:Amino acid adenylation domain-containing protein n=1 Tax=Bradyrhizobium ontarionense TaxID=2898149 RepID=A0ABY3R9N0_9BRAD|nr:non-ribosomal peptide synthetase/type I polyketide synthase [Bradyrhizobium sp. A19]UFZ04090.1 amino acid adenylation domain-containing protein [Bradyrhizobium sp. A19]